MSGIEEAIKWLGGSLEDVAVVARVTSQAVSLWRAAGRMNNARHVILVHEATVAAGHPVSMRRLAGLPDVPKAARDRAA
jgi:hypothetical protein